LQRIILRRERERERESPKLARGQGKVERVGCH